MDYKKKYKALVGRINKAYLYAQTDSTKAVLEDILPKLKESEDEKIRIELLDFCKNRAEKYPNDPKYKNISAWIAWLEKQRDPKPFDEETALSLAKDYRVYCQEIGIEDADTLNEIEDAYCYGLTHDFYWRNKKSQRMVSAEAKEAGYGKVEQKPSWSDEDEEILNSVIEEIMPFGECPHYPTDEDREYYYSRAKMIDWLKSLKERYSWELGDEQLGQTKE